MRVVKEARERRNEILDVAQDLFSKKGFDGTSTNDILERVGIARGTLYYHFKSKEEILDSLIERMTWELMSKSAAIASNKEIPLLDRLSLSIMALNIDTSIGHEMMEQVHKPQNALMHQKMQQQLLSGIVPIISGLIMEGIEQGVFETDYPYEAVEMTMLYSNVTFDEMADISPDMMQRKIMGFIYNVERLVGAKPGTLTEAIIRIFEKK